MESPAPDSNDLSLSGPHPKVHVVGLLATTDLKSHKDRWRGVDFAAFRDLFSEATHSIWLTAAEWDDSAWKPIIGDPHAQRLELPALPPVAVVSLQIITAQFLLSVGKVAATAQEDDTVVIVLCGHGDEDTGHLVIGGAAGYRSPLSKEEVELALADVRVPRRRIFVVTIACYSGQWRSEAWTLFAAADRFQTSAAMTTSASGEGRGSMFTYALLAERADGHGLTAPHPVCKIYPADHVWKADSEEVLVWDAPVKANKHDDTARPDLPRRSTQDAHAWMENLRLTMGGNYNEATFVVEPVSSDPSELPIRPFTAEYLQRLQVVGPSIPIDSGKTVVGAVEGHIDHIPPLSLEDRTALQELAIQHSQVERASVSIDRSVNEMAKRVANGLPLSEVDERVLLECLRYRDRDSRRATAIAAFFCWKTSGAVEKWTRGNGLEDMMGAESLGAAIATEFFFGPKVGARWWDVQATGPNTDQRAYKTMGPGAWLADVWMQAGRPMVEVGEWKKAVEHANEAVGRTL